MNELDEEYQRLALEARDWIEAVTKKKFAAGDFIEALSDGVMLCRCVLRARGSVGPCCWPGQASTTPSWLPMG